jgi:hypothetical protein
LAKKKLQKASLVLFFFLAAVGLAQLLSRILQYGVDFPFYDEWGFFGDFIKSYVRGSWKTFDFFASHNGHRIATTRLTYVLLYHLSMLERSYAYLLNWLFGVGIITLWHLILKRTFSSSGVIPVSIAIVAIFLTTSPHQLENWTWGFQIQWFQHVFGLLLVVYLLSGERLYLGISFCVAVVSTFTISAGQLIWPLSVFLLAPRVLSGKLRPFLLGLWIAGAAVVLALYRRHLDSDTLSLAPLLHNPFGFLDTYATLLGAAIARASLQTARWFGILCIIVFLPIAALTMLRIFRFRGEGLTHLASLVGLVGFGFAATFLVALARHELGGARYVFEASRYTTLASVTWIAGFACTYSVLAGSRPGSLFLWGLLGVMVWGYYESLEPCHRDWAHRRWLLSSARTAILSSDPAGFRTDGAIKEATQRIGFFSFDTLDLLYQERLSPFQPETTVMQTSATEGHSSAPQTLK